ncbi:hypothetical protein CR513_28312, partial [Mucuna pruriens]
MSTSRAEAERLLAIGEKLLQSRDLSGSKDFAILAQEAELLLEGSDQILAIVDVLLAAEKPINNDHLDWYAILQLDRTCQDLDLIRKQYRRLGLLLHPDKNPFSLADHAFKLVADAWAVLSDPVQKALYDRDVVAGSAQSASFWTACPYCYFLYEYPALCEGCCLRCQNRNCKRSFHGLSIPSLPPLVPGREAYYCNWGFFPMGFVFGGPGPGPAENNPNVIQPVAISNGVDSELGSASLKRKRGRQRKVVNNIPDMVHTLPAYNSCEHESNKILVLQDLMHPIQSTKLDLIGPEPPHPAHVQALTNTGFPYSAFRLEVLMWGSMSQQDLSNFKFYFELVCQCSINLGFFLLICNNGLS